MKTKKTALAAAVALAALSGFQEPAGADDVTVPKLKPGVAVDGKLDEWANVAPVQMSEPKVDDLKVEGAWFAWDEKALSFAVKAKDKTVMDAASDFLELRLCPDVSRRDVYILVKAAPGADGKPSFVMTRNSLASKTQATLIENPRPDDPSGVKWTAEKRDGGWLVEATLPFQSFGAVAPKAGMKLPFVLSVYDRDFPASERDEWKQWRKRSESYSSKKPSNEWPCLSLAE